MRALLTTIVIFICLPGYGQVLMKEVPVLKGDSLKAPVQLRNLNIVSPIAPNYYTTGFGFFCKQELKLEKVNVPLKVRVGDPNYCNYLESKGATVIQK